MSKSGLELIQSFIIVAEELNFRRSAERMNIDQSALSRRIQKLEHLLDFPLFERTTRDVSLTPAGRAFYDENSRIFQNYSKSIETARLVAIKEAGFDQDYIIARMHAEAWATLCASDNAPDSIVVPHDFSRTLGPIQALGFAQQRQ